jgi:hypothetical protein
MAAAIGWFADPIFLGRESVLMRQMLGERLPTFTPEEWELLRDSSDYYGCNTCAWSDVGPHGESVVQSLTDYGRYHQLYQRWGRRRLYRLCGAAVRECQRREVGRAW